MQEQEQRLCISRSMMAVTTPPRVLVIDDDEIVRETMIEVLRMQGFVVFELPSPIGATNAIVNNEIHAVVIDVNMPTMSGDKLATLLKKNRRLAKLGVVLVSGCSTSELAEIASAVDASEIVDKANLHNDLVPAVRRALTR